MNANYILLSAYFILALVPLVVECNVENEIDSPSKLLPEDYDPSQIPRSKGNPVDVLVEVSVLNVRSIKDSDLTYTLDIFFNLYWKDYRLRGPNRFLEQALALDSAWKSRLWIPEINFKNSINGQVINFMNQMLYFKVYELHRVLMSMRLSLNLLCPMDFSHYPHDTQKCSIDLMSLSHNNHSMTLSWKKFRMTKELYSTRFEALKGPTSRCDKSYGALGTYSCIKGEITLKRFLGYFIIQKYLPTTIVVFMCFVGFWIPCSAYPARTALAITALLALITQQISNASMNVSYVMALHVWMLICIAFVFMALLELALAIYWAQRQQAAQSADVPQKVNEMKLIERPVTAEKELSPTADVETLPSPRLESFETEKKRLAFWATLVVKLQRIAQTSTPTNPIDAWSRILFPICFTISIALYVTYAHSKL